MANLLSIAEQAFHQLFPSPNDETAVKLEEIIATSKGEYSYQLWLKSKADKREDGEFQIPSYLLNTKELDVVNNEIDISTIKLMRGFDQETWLQNIGGVNCECRYIKSTLNQTQLLCDDDSLPEDARTYYVIGKKIKFPKGTHKDKLTITYASYGENIDEKTLEVDDVIGAIVRRELINIYVGKTGKEDVTNNSNSTT